MTDTSHMAHRELERRRSQGARDSRYVVAEATGCEGMLWIVDREGPIWTLECDGCRFVGGLPARHADPSLLRQLRVVSAGEAA